MSSAWNNFPEVPDLLRRFAAAPYEADWVIGQTPVHIETNHPEILRAFLPFQRQQQPISGLPYSLKAIVDPELATRPRTSPLEIDNGDIVVGNICDMFFALDRENQELMLFMSRFVAANFSELVFRLLSRKQYLQAAS